MFPHDGGEEESSDCIVMEMSLLSPYCAHPVKGFPPERDAGTITTTGSSQYCFK